MRYLLDTHTFLWFINDDVALSQHAKRLIEHPDHDIYLSVVSIWEMGIKISLGKLALPSPFEDFIALQIVDNNLILLDIKIEHVTGILRLPFHHRDPFDRLLLAQAQYEKLTIIGNDNIFPNYGISIVW
ncbi:MAG: type II toxin-antitoxin system VapC family toxin [bacterium]|nr:type II toxin-antitoxin system VapC family toxin [bacterium]